MSDTLNSDVHLFDGPVFTTASARRTGGLIKFKVAGNVLTDDEESVRYVEHVLAVHPAIDIVRFGQLFSRFIKAVNEANERKRARLAAEGQNPDDESADPSTTEAMSNLDLINEHVEPSLDALRSCLTPKSRPLFDEVRPAIDVNTLFDIIVMLTGELSPVDFSQRADSSDGSPGTGEASADGAPTEA